MKKVNMDVMQRWIQQRITSLLGFEDDIVVGTCVNYLVEEVGLPQVTGGHMRGLAMLSLSFRERC